MKKITIFIAVILMLLPVCAYADTQKALLDAANGNVFIEGKIDPVNVTEKGMSVLLRKKNAEITDSEYFGYVNQFTADNDGSYSHEFNFQGNILDYELLVYNGNTYVPDTVQVAVFKETEISDAELKISEDGSVYTLTAQVSHISYADEAECCAIIVGYDTDGRMISFSKSETAVFDGNGLQTKTLSASLSVPVARAKGFLWKNFTTVVPICKPQTETGEFFAYSWSIPGSDAPNVYPLFYLYPQSGTRPEDPEKTACAYLYDGNYEKAAQTMKTFMESRPKEGRVIIPHMGKIMYNTDPEYPYTFDNWFWWDDGINDVISRLDNLFYKYKEIGGPEIEGVFFDFEAGCDNSNISWGRIGGDETTKLDEAGLEETYSRVIEDERYVTDIRPELEKRGFEFYTGDDHTELYYYYKKTSGHTESYWIGQQFAKHRKADYMNKIYEAVKKHYPDIIFNNYGAYESVVADTMLEAENATWHQNTPEESERVASPVGTHASPVLYGQMPLNNDRVIKGYEHGDTFKKTPFNGALAVLQKMQRATAYSDKQMIMPWIMHYTADYSASAPTPYSATEYYKELVLHLGLCNARAFLFFNAGIADLSQDWASSNALMSKLCDELNALVGYSGRTSLVTEPISGNKRYLLTGMKANGRNVWRITPDIYTPDGEGHITKESFLKDADNLIFRIGNQVIDFPQDSYIYEYEKENSSLGYWVISPAETVPEEYTDVSFEAPAYTDYVYKYGAEQSKLKKELGLE